jgi:hypothetical protein
LIWYVFILGHKVLNKCFESTCAKYSIELAWQEEESNSSEVIIKDEDEIFFPSSSSGRPLQRTPSQRGSQRGSHSQ